MVNSIPIKPFILHCHVGLHLYVLNTFAIFDILIQALFTMAPKRKLSLPHKTARYNVLSSTTLTKQAKRTIRRSLHAQERGRIPGKPGPNVTAAKNKGVYIVNLS